MMRGLGAALHCDARRLVEHEQIVVLVEGDGSKEGTVRLGQRLRCRRCRRSRRQRRHANGLTRGEPCARLGAAAVDPNLAGAQQFLEPAVRQVGVMAPEPAVEPHAVLAGLDRPHFDWQSLRHGPSGKWGCT